jgi:hypothetical protein
VVLPRMTCRTRMPSGSSTAASRSRASAALAKRFSETNSSSAAS